MAAQTFEAARGALVVNNFSPYAQNFNFLSNSGSFNQWTDDAATESASGSPGWLWQNSGTPTMPLVYEAGGAAISPVGATYALMESGNPATANDQAMGNLNGSANPYTAWGVVFQNNTGQTITGVQVSYVGEQWRRARVADMLQFSFRASSSPITDLAPAVATPMGWTTNLALSFTSPVVDSVNARFVLDGNVAANRQQRTDTLSVSVGVGEYFALRWRDADPALNQGGALGIDDLIVTFQTASVPEASGLLLSMGACTLAAAGALMRRLGRANPAATRRE